MVRGFLHLFSLRSLQFKFSLISAVVFLVIFSIASYVLIRQSSEFEKSSLVARTRTFSSLATKPLGDAYTLYFHAGSLKFREILRETLSLNDTVPRVQIISVDGNLLFDSNNIDNTASQGPNFKISDPKTLQAVSGDQETQVKDENGDINEVIVPYSDDFGIRPFSLRYFISYESIYANIDRAILTTAVLVVLLFLTTLAAVTFLVNRSILSPLAKIITTARQIREGNLDRRIEIEAKDELGDLASSLNQMTDVLRKNIESLQQVDKLKDEFILIASHNLRTPLTIIKDYIPFLKEKDLDKESLEMISAIATSAEKLEGITESLLSLVSLERDKEPLRKTPEDLVTIVKELAEEAKLQADKKKISFTLALPLTPVQISIDKARIKQALANVVDNAIKFNREGGKVEIKIEVKESELVISVADTGIGISKEELDKIFQKFHRGTDVLTYNYEGIGLGLYLTKIVVESHEGKIWVESNLGQGTTVYIKLPLNSQA